MVAWAHATRLRGGGCGGSKANPAVAPNAAAKAAAAEGKDSNASSRRKSVLIEQREALDFKKVMEEVEGVEALLTFARSEFNDEVLLLWIDILKLKRDLADVSLWDSSGGGGGGSSDKAAAPAPAAPAKPAADVNPFDGGVPDVFAGANIFDEDEATRAGAGKSVSSGLGADEPPPPEAASADRAGFLKRRCHEIIDTYLCNGAEFQVTLPDHQYKKRSDVQSPPYELSETMFDGIMATCYRSIKQETWMRFRLTDAAEELALRMPSLMEDAEEDAPGGSPGAPETSQDAVRELREMLRKLTESIHCERATVWMVNHLQGRLWNVASTHLGNSVISIRLQHGLAGKAATTATDIVQNDAQNDAAFLNRIDKEIKFTTKSVLCVALTSKDRRPSEVIAAAASGEEAAAGGGGGDGAVSKAVVQLINKRSGDGADASEGTFDEADIARVRGEAGASILATCNAIHLHQLLAENATAASPGDSKAGFDA